MLDIVQLKRLSALEALLDYSFHDKELLFRALTHRSFNPDTSNERLEFLGDSILGAIISAHLYEFYGDLDEGEMSRFRATLVRATALVRVGQRLKLEQFLTVGEGEVVAGGFKRPNILADAVEAIIGAIFKDGGFEEASRVAKYVWSDDLALANPERCTAKDPKSELQELVQSVRLERPSYTVLQCITTGGRSSYNVICKVSRPGEPLETEGFGKTKKDAEKMAAREAIQLFRSYLEQAGLGGEVVQPAVGCEVGCVALNPGVR